MYLHTSQMEKFHYSVVFALLSLNYHVLKADLGAISHDGEGYIFPYPKECTDILGSFADYASNFTLCSIQHARPIRLCEKCVDQYVRFHDKYKELATTIINGTSCVSLYVSQDRLDAVLEHHDNIQSIWDKGNCNSCFYWSSNGPVLSNNTIRFNKMYNTTRDCIVTNYFNVNSTEVCEKCMQSYLGLDEFYNTLSTDYVGIDTVCMDIVDSMNTTRSIWSKTLGCCKMRQSPELIFLCCTGIISMLPLLFYLAVRYCGPIRDLPNVLKQSRFKDIFKSKK